MSWLSDPQALALIGREADDVDAVRWTGVVAAAVEWVEGRRPDIDFHPEDETPPVVGADVILGTAMLAGRWYDRGATPGGIAEHGEFGGAILRHDPDIARLLGVGWSGRFVVGGPR